jgi:hypothetical protein
MYPSSSERIDHPATNTFKTYEELQAWLVRYPGSLLRVTVYEANELGLKLIIGDKDAPEVS